MLWFGMLHLLIGNYLIGVFEAFFARRYFKLQVSYGWIILGNYLSMLVGMFLVAPMASKFAGNLDFWGADTGFGSYKLLGLFAGLIAAYFVTLIVETPFYAIIKEDRPNIYTIVKVSVITNFVSYIVMTIIYFLINLPGGMWK